MSLDFPGSKPYTRGNCWPWIKALIVNTWKKASDKPQKYCPHK